LRPVYDASKRKNRNDSRRYYDQTDCHSILIALETVLKLKAVTQQAVHVWSVLLRALEELRSAVILRQTKLQQEAIRVATTRQSVASRLIDTGYFYEPGSLAVMVLDNGTSPIAECHKELAAKVCTLRILELANINLFANTVYLYCHLSYIYMYITLYAVGLLIGPSASVHGTGSMQYFDGAGSFSINELSSGFSAENNVTYCNSFGQGHYYPCSEVFCGTTFLPLLIQQAWMHFKHKSDGLFIRIQTLLDNIDAATVSGGSAMKVDSEGTSIATQLLTFMQTPTMPQLHQLLVSLLQDRDLVNTAVLQNCYNYLFKRITHQLALQSSLNKIFSIWHAIDFLMLNYLLMQLR